MKKEIHRLGDYIRPVDVRNRDLKVTELLGLSMSKQFRPSTSNVVGVDLSKYKVVNKNVFAFDPMSVIRVHKVPIAINNTDSPIIVSPAYITFECKDVNELEPNYLMMWFQRPEFDRYADFKSDAAVRGGYDWTELCETMVYIPSITRQRGIVAEYETLTNRIRLNEQIIQRLEATAQALYRKMFVDNIDKENLPAGWRMAELGTLVDIRRGSSPRPIDQYMATVGLPWLKISDATNAKSPFIFEVKEYIKEDGLSSTVYRHAGDLILSNSASPGLPKFLEIDSCIHDGWLYFDNSQVPLIFLYLTFQYIRKDLVAEGNGAIFINLKTEILKKWNVLLPDKKSMETFCSSVDTLFALMKTTALEKQKISQIQSLLMSKMGQ